MVAPGLAGLETVLTLHDAARIGSPDATWGVREGNPVHDDVRAIAAGTGVNFALDVILNREQEIVSSFAGELFAMHDAAATQPGASRWSGWRSSSTWYLPPTRVSAGSEPVPDRQGMSAAEKIVKDGGVIICAAECRDGLPDGGEYERSLASASTIGELRRSIENRERAEPDQWQVQIQARIQERASVLVYSDYLSEQRLRAAHLEKAEGVEEAVREALDAAGP